MRWFTEKDLVITLRFEKNNPEDYTLPEEIKSYVPYDILKYEPFLYNHIALLDIWDLIRPIIHFDLYPKLLYPSQANLDKRDVAYLLRAKPQLRFYLDSFWNRIMPLDATNIKISDEDAVYCKKPIPIKHIAYIIKIEMYHPILNNRKLESYEI
jgi:hypothetical protein